jgi:RNA ligase (TIGR02306 family)
MQIWRDVPISSVYSIRTLLMTRKLASIRLIKDVNPIEGADNIEKVTIDGWTCVAKKGEFTAGQPCIYFEIDSFLPVRPEFEFLRKTSYRKMGGDQEGFRLKTIRLRGVLSQGLALPLSIFQPILQDSSGNIGDDVTERLGVVKYEPPVPAELQGIVKGLFPAFVCKTDQERVQNLWDDIKDNQESFEVTLKLDGTSCTYYYHNGTFGVCSRNLELLESETNTLWKIARKYKLEELLHSLKRNIAIQGEIIGEGIQKNPEKLKGQDFYLFDIWDINERHYLSPDIRHKMHEQFFSQLKHIPILDSQCYLNSFQSIEAILSAADGASLNSPIREGIVFRSNESGLTFKAISNQYLLAE